ncbi:hypothetical protein [Xanthomonas sacchari]|uniref:hypothetical protein n=1 Tax=Xanthomonas sacchari TaxID=56458 RepID=UPI00224CE04C|nr:hypothetical protein [Xanthomonas sacchari]
MRAQIAMAMRHQHMGDVHEPGCTAIGKAEPKAADAAADTEALGPHVPTARPSRLAAVASSRGVATGPIKLRAFSPATTPSAASCRTLRVPHRQGAAPDPA